MSQRNDTLAWVEINNENCPTLKKYGVKPFKIMKYKMRNDKGEVWNNINYYDAEKEAKNRGLRLPTEDEIKALRDHYLATQKKFSIYDKEFLGIEELSYKENVCYEWLEGGFLRGGAWNGGVSDGAFTLALSGTPGSTYYGLGFRMCQDIKSGKTIDLTQGKQALVDEEDFDFLNQYKWHTSKGRNTFYAEARVDGKQVRMHTLLLDKGENAVIDHIDKNGLNNQKSNLRLVSVRENALNAGNYKNNTSGYQGVYFHKASKKWAACITIMNESIHLGLFDTKEEASKAYQAKKANTITLERLEKKIDHLTEIIERHFK